MIKDEIQSSCPSLIHHMHTTSLMLPFLHSLLFPGFGFLLVCLEFYLSISNSSPDSSIEVKNLFLICYKHIWYFFSPQRHQSLSIVSLNVDLCVSRPATQLLSQDLSLKFSFYVGSSPFWMPCLPLSRFISLCWSTSSISSFLRKGVWEISFLRTYKSRTFVQILNSRLERVG